MSNTSISTKEIDILNVFVDFWKYKFIIILLSLSLAVVGYFYGVNKDEIYETQITIRDANPSLFVKFQNFGINTQISGPELLQKNKSETNSDNDNFDILSAYQEFNNEIEIRLISIDTLIRFLDQSNDFDYLKSYFDENNIDLKSYFKGSLKETNSENFNQQISKYSLIFKKPIEGKKLLNNYVNYVVEEAKNNYKNRVSNNISSLISVYSKNLKIADEIDLKFPILKSIVEGRSIVNEPNALFYKGTKVLKQELIFLEQALNNTENIEFDYEPILESATEPVRIGMSPLIYSILAFFIGFIISLMVLVFRSVIII